MRSCIKMSVFLASSLGLFRLACAVGYPGPMFPLAVVALRAWLGQKRYGGNQGSIFVVIRDGVCWKVCWWQDGVLLWSLQTCTCILVPTTEVKVSSQTILGQILSAGRSQTEGRRFVNGKKYRGNEGWVCFSRAVVGANIFSHFYLSPAFPPHCPTTCYSCSFSYIIICSFLLSSAAPQAKSPAARFYSILYSILYKTILSDSIKWFD